MRYGRPQHAILWASRFQDTTKVLPFHAGQLGYVARRCWPNYSKAEHLRSAGPSSRHQRNRSNVCNGLVPTVAISKTDFQEHMKEGQAETW
jgi:hypothetical protein